MKKEIKDYIYKNNNGMSYIIIDFNGIIALLKNVNSGEFVVANGFSPFRDSWDQGFYFIDMVEASEKFNELRKVNKNDR